MNEAEFKPPRRAPSRRSHLDRLVDDYSRAHGIAPDRVRRWLSVVSFIGTLDAVRSDDGPRFLIKGGVAMELRFGLRARSTRDVDVVFRGSPSEMLDALDEAFELAAGGFSFRRKGPITTIRDTGSRRLSLQVGFAGRDWQTLQLEVGPPEVDELEFVPVAISIADFKLEGPARVACLSLRYQIAQKLHAVTERPVDRDNQRYWDLIDLVLLRELVGVDIGATTAACIEVFSRRGTHEWPPQLFVPEAWDEPYRATAATIDADTPADVEKAADEVRAFIAELSAFVQHD